VFVVGDEAGEISSNFEYRVSAAGTKRPGLDGLSAPHLLGVLRGRPLAANVEAGSVVPEVSARVEHEVE
jgi:hypothetical protein